MRGPDSFGRHTETPRLPFRFLHRGTAIGEPHLFPASSHVRAALATLNLTHAPSGRRSRGPKNLSLLCLWSPLFLAAPLSIWPRAVAAPQGKIQYSISHFFPVLHREKGASTQGSVPRTRPQDRLSDLGKACRPADAWTPRPRMAARAEQCWGSKSSTNTALPPSPMLRAGPTVPPPLRSGFC